MHSTYAYDMSLVTNFFFIEEEDHQCSEVIYNYLSDGSPPDSYEVTLTVFNPMSRVDVARNYTLQRRVEDIKLYTADMSVTRNTSTFWDLDFGTIGSDACYFLDLVDGLMEENSGGVLTLLFDV